MKMMNVSPQHQQCSKFRRRIRGIVVVVLGLALYQVSQVSNMMMMRRALSSYDNSCNIKRPTLPSQPIIPVFAASYPGSGSQMTHYLYEAITGVDAGSAYLHRGDDFAHVTLKTHYPVRKHKVEGDRLMHRVILQLRNPIHAIPSYHSFLYEKEHDLPDHTLRAPIDAWLKWRDGNFDKEIENWKHHLLFWINKFPKREDRLVISYERLIDSRMGPVETTRIANFLGRTEGVEITSLASTLPCIWDKVVNYHKREETKDDETEATIQRKMVSQKFRRSDYSTLSTDAEDPANPFNSLRKGNVNYTFTKRQLEKVHSVLAELRGHYLDEYTLVIILTGYIEEVNQLMEKM